MTVSIADIRHAIEIMLIEIYPDISALGEGCYSLNDILDQLIFELIKRTTLIISKKPGNTGISRDIRTEFTTDLLLSD